ncbi:hypothetical protein V1525DRAFT_441089 [Lipomyces kononenkoae]|uniref:Uncharacterized protein n=1 Tax=Lipomyces kononenkoae TaxID=34357 RepID=A0ACC3SQ61_LIPKO
MRTRGVQSLQLPPLAKTFEGRKPRSCLLVDISRAQSIQLRLDNKVVQLIKLGYMTNAPSAQGSHSPFELLKIFHMLKNTGGLSADAFAKVLRQSLEQSYLQQFVNLEKVFRDTYYRWLRMHREARKRQDDAIEVAVHPTETIRFSALANLCPACFGCADGDTREDRPTISIDDNFQHVHYKDVSPIAEPEPEYFFVDPTKTETGKVKANSCASNFQAPKQKPGDNLFDSQGYWKSSAGTVILSSVVITKGEPFGDVVHIVKQVVERYRTAARWGLTYDVGCALESPLTVCPHDLMVNIGD